MSLSISLQFTFTLIGPRGDSCDSSITTTVPAAAACLFNVNHVVSPVQLLSNIFLNTLIMDLDLICSYMILKDAVPKELPTILLLSYGVSKRHSSITLLIAAITFLGSSDGLMGASTFTSTWDVICNFFIYYLDLHIYL